MVAVYPFLAAVALAFLHTHTDELPIVLASVLLLALVGGGTLPGRWLSTALVIGSALPIAELLVHFGVLRAPWPSPGALPWAALIAYVPAFTGVGIGSALRKAL
jgi:hypothetical protein